MYLTLNRYLSRCSYNGYLPQGDRGRRRSKFVLHKRTEASGVKRSKHYIVQSPQTSKAILDANQHSISYTLSRNQAVIVEYKEDTETDMFQVRHPKGFWAARRSQEFRFHGLTLMNVVCLIRAAKAQQ